MLTDQRTFERFKILAPMEFIPLKKPTSTFFGIVNNFSCGGFSLETLYLDLEPGENLDFKSKHPENDLLVSFVGTVVWKDKIDKFACLMGIEFKEKDIDIRLKILELISVAGNISIDSLFSDRDIESELGDKEQLAAKLNDSQEEDFRSELFERNPEGTNISGSEDKKLFKVENTTVSAHKFDSPDDDIVESVENTAEAEKEKTVHEKRMDFYREFTKKELRRKPDLASKNTPFKAKNQKNKTSKHILLIIAVSVFLVLTLSVEMEDIRNGFKSQSLIQNKLITSQDLKKNIPLYSTENIQPSEKAIQNLPQSGKQQPLQEAGTKMPEHDEVANSEQSMINKVSLENKEYFIQVGAWRTSAYSKKILAELNKYYPDAYIVKQNNFNKIRIPGIITISYGKQMIKDIEDKFNVKPMLVKVPFRK